MYTHYQLHLVVIVVIFVLVYRVSLYGGKYASCPGRCWPRALGSLCHIDLVEGQANGQKLDLVVGMRLESRDQIYHARLERFRLIFDLFLKIFKLCCEFVAVVGQG